MTGHTINVQGNYIDIHDNEVVNLNIDKGTVMLLDEREKASVLTNNDKFMQILDKAVEQGFCIKNGWQYKWNIKTEAAYFAAEASHKFNLSTRADKDGDLTISWIPFEALFGVTKLRLNYNDYKQCKTILKRKTELDKLFKNLIL